MFARPTSQAFARPTLVYARPNANDIRDAKKRTTRYAMKICFVEEVR
jgi:hypothetical protein